MDSSVFSLKNPWIASFLIPIFTFICGNFTLFIITSLILCSSAFLFLTHSNHNVQVTKHRIQVIEQEVEIDPNQATIVEDKGCLDVGFSSESEIIDQFSCTSEEDCGFDGWNYSGEGCRRLDCSDGSISDEESLIEIELLGGHSVGFKEDKDEEEPKFCRRQKSPDSVLGWPEMNEEENMIEIDLSVGSIKC
ncbi:hypothetical protein L1987_55477 [Smallanthus sonchifolius]|uniref:Uncharacterized protein n=1 Tax=Smallanthus sonchifolius TaxID=185202 RepID=A0ACB9EA62_9ASTR|nr:hypothetical protein L1987_55477 [Smallanthus sonchifolius]